MPIPKDDSHIQDIITNVFSLIESHGEKYVNAFIKNLVDTNSYDEFVIADYIILQVRRHYKVSHKSLLTASCRGEIRDAKRVVIGVIDGLINIQPTQMIQLLNITNTKGLYRLRQEVLNLSEKVKHEREMLELITKIAIVTKDKFKIE